uniref:Uncharacterized protein n=1 Tax=Anguilla anguilla TaxID=7936 RepID=A0A0E9SS07_ANGAN
MQFNVRLKAQLINHYYMKLSGRLVMTY